MIFAFRLPYKHDVMHCKYKKLFFCDWHHWLIGLLAH